MGGCGWYNVTKKTYLDLYEDIIAERNMPMFLCCVHRHSACHVPRFIASKQVRQGEFLWVFVAATVTNHKLKLLLGI